MSYSSGEAAEQVVRMTLNGVEVAAKISGKAAERLAVLLYAVLKDQKKTRGKTRLTSMLRSGKELKVFSVSDNELEKFCREAKKYGVLYCVLKDKTDTDGHTDVFVRAEDASKINRIFERFGIATTDLATARGEIVKANEEKNSDRPEPDRHTTEKDKDIREELFYALAKANCPILELTSSSMSLEDVFLELTDDSGKAARKLKKAEKEQLKQKECEKECEPEADKTAVGEVSEEKSTDAAESAAETKQEEGDAQ